MQEIGIAVAGLYLRDQSPATVHGIGFELVHIERFVLRNSVNIHIGKSGSYQFGDNEALVELAAFADALDQAFGNHLSRRIIDRIVAQHFGFGRPILHDLRRELHEIALHPAERPIFHVGEKRMQPVPKLMKKGLDLIERKQRRRQFGRRSKIAYDGDHRSDAFVAFVALAAERGTPRTAALAAARKKVEIEHAQMSPVHVEHLIYRAILVVNRCDQRTERNPVKPVRQRKSAFPNIFERKIGPQRSIVERIFVLAHLFGVIPPIPGFERRPRHIPLQHRIHLGHLFLGAIERRRPHFVQQLINGSGRSGHLIGRHISRIGGIAQQAGFLVTQAGEIVHQRAVIVLAAFVATVDICFVQLLPQVALSRIREKRNPAGSVERNDPRIVQSQLRSLLPGHPLHACRQPVELFLRQFQHKIIRRPEDIIAEFHGQQRQFAVNLTQPLLLLRIEQRSRPHELTVNLLHQARLHGIEAEAAATVVNGFDLVEKHLVEQNIVPMGGQQRHRLLFRRQ